MDKKQLLQKKKWAVVGDVLNAEKFAFRIVATLRSKGYDVFGVHPAGGVGIYKTLGGLPALPDVVCLVINPKLGASYLEEAHALGIQHLWLQPGADAPEILSRCRDLNLDCTEACVLVALRSESPS